jgi:serine/threonine-protein kinase RsbW/stage II sporulation protein AB (anti-sigma F factor)
VRWTVPAVPEQAGPLRRLVTAYAGEMGMLSPRLGEVALAVGEAIANAVVHAYRDAAEGTVDVTAGVGDGALVVSVRDQGCGLRPRPDSPGLGLGLGLISQVTDSLRICQGDRCGTEVHMTFLLPVSRALARPGAAAQPRLRADARAL